MRRVTARTPLIIAAIAGVMSLIVGSAMAQGVSHEHGAHTTLRMSVNGAESPHLIPDYIAQRHFVLSLATEGTVDSSEGAIAALVKRLALAPTDERLLRKVLLTAASDVAALETASTQLGQQSITSGDEHNSARDRRHQALDAAWMMIAAEMSPVARTAIRRHVDEFVKPRIVIYGDTP